jgi:hypothetical protein
MVTSVSCRPCTSVMEVTNGCSLLLGYILMPPSSSGFMLALTVKIVVFWVMTPYRFMGRCQIFGRTCCLHLPGWKWRQHVPPKLSICPQNYMVSQPTRPHLFRHCHRSLRTYMNFKGICLLWCVGTATLSACETVHGSLKIIHVLTQWPVTESFRNFHGILHIKKCHLYRLSLSAQSVILVKNREARSFLF